MIEEAGRGDPEGCAAAMAAVAAASFAEPWSPAGLAETLRRPEARGYLARDGAGRVCGYLLARGVGGELEILSLAVAPAARRAGVGRALLGAVLAAARAAGIDDVHLEVRAGATPARRLYQAAGFRVVGRRPRYYRDGEDALLLRRSGAETRAVA